MDGLNNNTINSFDMNYGNTYIFGDDLRNHNESRNTARVTPLTNPPYSSQECRRLSMERLKDRQIAILTQKNNQLQMDVLAMQCRASSNLPMMYEYGVLESYGTVNNHLQLKLLTTALSEKSEELKQAKEEYDLIMQERAAVHKELREQTAEIERLKRQNYYLQDQFRSNNTGSFDLTKSVNEKWPNQVRDMGKENESLKFELSQQKKIIQNLTDEKEQSTKQLDQVVNHYHYLKKSFNQKQSFTEPRLQQFMNEKCEILNETIKVTDLKMALLNIVFDNSGDSDNGGHFKQLEDNKTPKFRTVSFHFRCDDRLLDIEGVDVTEWTDEQILDHLSRHVAGKYVRVVLSRPRHRSGTFLSWKAGIKISKADQLGLSPLWLVTNGDLLNCKDEVNTGDILQVRENVDGTDSVAVVRLSSSHFLIPVENVDRNPRLNSGDDANDFIPTIAVTPNVFFPPVLPKKKRCSSTSSDVHPKSLDRLMSVNIRTDEKCLSKKSSSSVVSAPIIPPRSSASLQCSFTENAEQSCTSNFEFSETVFNDECVGGKLKVSVHSAFSRMGDIDESLLGSGMMSVSFSDSTDFVSTKMPKLGKCRNVILNIPSQVFTLKQLGLNLFHSKNDQCPSSKSDVDVSVINQIFIRNIEPNSSAKQAGLIEGDEIISINNQPVSKMTSEEAEHILMTNLMTQQKERRMVPLLIKVQFNPLKMYELSKESLDLSLQTNDRFARFTRSMYDDFRSGSFAQDKWNSHRLHVIRSSSNLNVSESPCKSINIFEHLLTKTRTVRINMCTVLTQIKIMGGSAIGVFISNIEYRDKECENLEKDSVGNRLALGDKIIDINGESYQRAIGEDAVTSLNRFSHQVTLTVLYEPSGLLAINSDPLCQEHFYIEAMFSFSEIDGKLGSISNKGEKSTSLSTRLDNFGFSIYFIKDYHLSFEKGDILLVDATILPASMTRRQHDNYIGCDWHAWVMDRCNNKIRSGMIPSALWLQKIIATPNKSTFYRSPLGDKSSRFSMRSTPSSPKSDINTFLSSNSTHIVSQPCSRHHRHSSLSQKLFRRFSIRNSFHSTTASVDETNRTIPVTKEVAFKPLKRISKETDLRRPIILLGPHSETISMILASKWSREFALETLKGVMESQDSKEANKIISPVSIAAVSELLLRNIYPIVLLLKYKSAKDIRQLKIGKNTQITMNKSESFRLLSQIKDLENNYFHLINGFVTPNSVNDICKEIKEMIDNIQKEDIWLRVDKYQYSA